MREKCILVFSKGMRVEMGKLGEKKKEEGGDEEDLRLFRLINPMAITKIFHTKMSAHGVGERLNS